MFDATVRRRSLLRAGGGALGVALAGAPARTQPRSGGTLNVGFNNDSRTFDPIFSVQFAERQVLYLVFNTLVKYGPDFSIHPELAKSWDISEDGKRIPSNCRKGWRSTTARRSTRPR